MNIPVSLPHNFDIATTPIIVDGDHHTTLLAFLNSADMLVQTVSIADTLKVVTDLITSGFTAEIAGFKIQMVSWGTTGAPHLARGLDNHAAFAL